MSDIALCCLVGLGAPLSLYVWSRPRLGYKLALADLRAAAALKSTDPAYFDRNDGTEIFHRTLSFGGFALTASLIANSFLSSSTSFSQHDGILAAYVVPGKSILATCRLILECGALTGILYLGDILDGPLLFATKVWHRVTSIFTPQQLRTVLIAPLIEEIIFRGVMITLLRKRRPLWQQLIVTSALFAFGHIHLFVSYAIEECRDLLDDKCAEDGGERWDQRLTDKEVDACWRTGKRSTLYQCTLVALYGCFSGWYYVSVCKRNVLAAALSHSLCNLVRAPTFLFASRKAPTWRRVLSVVAHTAGVLAFVAAVRKRG